MILLLDVLGIYETAEQKAKAPGHQYIRMRQTVCVCAKTFGLCLRGNACWGVRGRTKVQQRREIHRMANGASSLLLLRLEFPFYRSMSGSCNHSPQPDVKFTSRSVQGMPLGVQRRQEDTHGSLSFSALRGLSARLRVAAWPAA